MENAVKSIKNDISTEEDIKLMVDSFYARVNENPLLSDVFNGFAKVDWDSHLPRMYQFWEGLILGKQGFKGNPFAVHQPLPINKEHFEQWIGLFVENIDALFEGEVTEQTKLRARSIAHIFESKLSALSSMKNDI
ncbi:group III truncated hemoglobin [Reichenbachiella versicolor]|uniref:group III truncated hemoglobin n=1 Tax=Reichenbachiella versicolor TaxID=1821036 RepID=UPI0016258869|nr:group III truncated hemoglobin [Reichenbachiella versicolor]